jgi:hypothetical protein
MRNKDCEKRVVLAGQRDKTSNFERENQIKNKKAKYH